jgi:hypothetical protein
MSELPGGHGGAATLLIIGTAPACRRRSSRTHSCMLGCRHTVSRTYGPSAAKEAPGIRVLMGSYAQA